MTNRQKPLTKHDVAPNRTDEVEFKGWLVDEEGKIVGGPVDVLQSYTNTWYAEDGLMLTGDEQTVCRLMVSAGESSVWEDPSTINVHPKDVVWIGKPGSAAFQPHQVTAQAEVWRPKDEE